MDKKYVIGVDFGTDSVRAVVVDAILGTEVARSVTKFERWSRGRFCDSSRNQFRQHPLDYIEGLESSIRGCLQTAGREVAQKVCGIAIATTGSTPVAVDKAGMPLALGAEFKDDPDAMFILWKDHTAIGEAEEINTKAKDFPIDYLRYVGGTYSSEWFWAKLLHVLRSNDAVRKACFTWVEHSDWMPFLLTGGDNALEIRRNVCAAGHKGLWANEFGGLPPVAFFESIDPLLVPFVGRFGTKTFTAGETAGNLCGEWAEKLGLSTNVVVGVGAIDAHVGAVGGNIKPYFMSKVIGTSTCDMMVVPKPDMDGRFIKGISGQVEDSIVPGMVGLEAGQSAFGDIYSWFRDLLLWPLSAMNEDGDQHGVLYDQLGATLLRELDRSASQLAVTDQSEFAVDWFNGRRSPVADPNLKGLIGGLTLGSTAPKIYRALVEATCFGSRAIVESVEEQGLTVKGIQALGGIAVKSEFVVQTLANVLNRPVEVSSSEQAVALGTAMFAAVACGIYPTVTEAGEVIGQHEGRIVNPQPELIEIYDRRYQIYKRYGAFETSQITRGDIGKAPSS